MRMNRQTNAGENLTPQLQLAWLINTEEYCKKNNCRMIIHPLTDNRWEQIKASQRANSTLWGAQPSYTALKPERILASG